jgi:hypothetical protein
MPTKEQNQTALFRSIICFLMMFFTAGRGRGDRFAKVPCFNTETCFVFEIRLIAR